MTKRHKISTSVQKFNFFLLNSPLVSNRFSIFVCLSVATYIATLGNCRGIIFTGFKTFWQHFGCGLLKPYSKKEEFTFAYALLWVNMRSFVGYSLFSYVHELKFCLPVFSQTWPSQMAVEYSAPPSVCHTKVRNTVKCLPQEHDKQIGLLFLDTFLFVLNVKSGRCAYRFLNYSDMTRQGK